MNTENQRQDDVAPAAENPVSDSPAVNEAAPVQEAVAAEQPEAAPATSEVVATSAEGDATVAAAPPKPRVQLNPTQPGQALPIPSIGEGRPVVPMPTAAVEVPAATDDEIDAEIAKAVGAGGSNEKKQVPDAPVAGQQPIDVPAVEDLDDSMQAMLDAALSGKGVDGEAIAASVDQSLDEIHSGLKLNGVVQAVNGENVLLDFGLRMSGCVPARQFNQKLPEVGASIEVVVDKVDDKEGLIMANLPRGTARVQGDWDSVQVDQVVECMVTKTNKGGLDVTVGSLRAFLPASQVELGFVADLEPFVGQKIKVVITEVKPKRRRLVVSRRKLLLEEREDSRRELMQELKVDDVRKGRVKTVKDFGAFIDLGGTDGFLPVSQMSWNRIGHPSEVLNEGDEVEVKVLSIDTEKQRISLGMRQLAPNPWKLAEGKYPKGSKVRGRVTRTEAFGAFVELEPGVEGLIHISELDHRRVKRVTEVVKVGDTPEVQILEVDPGKKRISLSLKAMTAAPEPVAPPADEDLAPGQGQPYQRKNRGKLKGGTGSKGGSGLFGNPRDFE
ncbi:MAG: S1 RNA-binding domain-containing protein [Planctomycetaceae bacterium]|nr:S1 RNA-binding domain-containing protein [Planctomycetaceae bacterium]